MAGNEMGPIEWVFDDDDLLVLLNAIDTAIEVTFDTETTGLDEHSVLDGVTNGGVAARMSMATYTLLQEFGVEPISYVLPLSHPASPFRGRWRAVLKQTLDAMLAGEKFIIGQNLKFDIKWSYAHTGVDISGLPIWDTQISSHLLDETRSTRLKERAPADFDIERWDDGVDLSKPGASERADMWVLGEYAARDTYWTWRLSEKHRAEMFLDTHDEPGDPEEKQRARLGDLAQWCAMPMVASLARIEERGFLIDVEWVKSELALNLIGRDTALEEMAQQYGQDPATASAAATSKWFKEFTSRAIEMGDLRIGALTPGGAPQWNKSVLKRQARTGSHVAELILTQRDHAKKAEFLQSWLDHATPEGIVHTTYHAGRVVTGRLSSSDPNMQQVSRVLKKAFMPRPGFAILDLDYSQIELRVAAFISRCEPMLEAFRRGDDLHTMLAAAITSKDIKDVTEDERQAGKSANFGLLYDMSPEGFREYADDVYGVQFTMAEAYAAHKAFFDMWDGIAEWHARVIATVEANGQIISPIGRIRRLPDIWAYDFRASSYAERQAINSPVQGFASDLMQMAAASIQGLLPGTSAVEGVYLVGTVHDSIVGEVRLDDWERVARECRERMLGLDKVLRRLGCVLDVPLDAEAKVGTRWGLSDIGSIG